MFFSKRSHPKLSTTAIGSQAEISACEYLKKQHLKPLFHQYRCRLGEIDLIMLDQETLVFIEVRYRKTSSYGSPAETITHKKQKKLIKTAYHFLQQHTSYQNHALRFDVIAMTSCHKTSMPSKLAFNIEWIKNAFGA